MLHCAMENIQQHSLLMQHHIPPQRAIVFVKTENTHKLYSIELEHAPRIHHISHLAYIYRRLLVETIN